jgi:glutaredoxin
MVIYTVFGRQDCPWCDKATDLLEQKGQGYSYYGIESDPWVRPILKKAGYTTVPVIFDNNGNEIGGYAELEKHLND